MMADASDATAADARRARCRPAADHDERQTHAPTGRHDFVYLDGRTRACSLAGPHDAATRRAIRAWLDAGWPFVVRQQGDIDDRRIALGLALPPGDGKRRIALTVERTCVARMIVPPALEDVLDGLPAGWQTLLGPLAARSRLAGFTFRVFGSVAWQALTGLAYVTASSDIDLVWQPRSRTDLARGVALLADWQRGSRVRADCEIVFPRGDAVAWREWIKRPSHARVLVKRLDGPRMCAADELLLTFDPVGIDARAAH